MKPLNAALRASAWRSAPVSPAVRPRKKGAASIGLTMGKRAANVSRKALATPLTLRVLSSCTNLPEGFFQYEGRYFHCHGCG